MCNQPVIVNIESKADVVSGSEKKQDILFWDHASGVKYRNLFVLFCVCP